MIGLFFPGHDDLNVEPPPRRRRPRTCISTRCCAAPRSRRRNIVGPEGIRPPDPSVEKTLTGWEYFPAAATIGVRAAWSLSDHTPVMVTENGIATADDSRRIDYTREALTDLHGCIDDGITLLGYQHWSALDNYEWASGFAPTFGLIGWAKETFVRYPKPSAVWEGELLARTGSRGKKKCSSASGRISVENLPAGRVEAPSRGTRRKNVFELPE